MSYAWFHGTLSSDEVSGLFLLIAQILFFFFFWQALKRNAWALQAFKILEVQPVGAYLVRVSTQRPACFVVSYVADHDKVIHVVWEWNDVVGWKADGQVRALGRSAINNAKGHNPPCFCVEQLGRWI